MCIPSPPDACSFMCLQFRLAMASCRHISEEPHEASKGRTVPRHIHASRISTDLFTRSHLQNMLPRCARQAACTVVPRLVVLQEHCPPAGQHATCGDLQGNSLFRCKHVWSTNCYCIARHLVPILNDKQTGSYIESGNHALQI